MQRRVWGPVAAPASNGGGQPCDSPVMTRAWAWVAAAVVVCRVGATARAEPVEGISTKCGHATGDRTVVIGHGEVPIPNFFTNRTSSTVRFRVELQSNIVIGGTRTVFDVTLPPGTDGPFPEGPVLPIKLTDAIGSAHFDFRMFSDKTGETLLQQCLYRVVTQAPPEYPDLLQVPFKVCVLEGSAPAGSSTSGTVRVPDIRALVDKVNATWLPQAHIVFRALQDDVAPVIADPLRADPAEPAARPGDISVEFPDQAEAAAAECNRAWSSTFGLFPSISVVIGRKLYGRGYSGGADGVTAPSPFALYPGTARKADLCQVPRKLTTADLPSYLVMADRAHASSSSSWPNAFNHELGHTLMLGHGDGIDQPCNGSPDCAGGTHDYRGVDPPAPGLRLFDQYCDCDTRADGQWHCRPQNGIFPGEDPAEPACTLMYPQVTGCTTLTSLQQELARDAAKVAAGATSTASPGKPGTCCNGNAATTTPVAGAVGMLLWRPRRRRGQRRRNAT